MIGKDLDEIFDLKRAHQNPDAQMTLEASHIGVPGKVEDISFAQKKGELLGFAGLLGSGRTETAEMLFGVTKMANGDLKVAGIPVKIGEPMDAINHKIAFCPEDRKRDGKKAGELAGENCTQADIMRIIAGESPAGKKEGETA